MRGAEDCELHDYVITLTFVLNNAVRGSKKLQMAAALNKMKRPKSELRLGKGNIS